MTRSDEAEWWFNAVYAAVRTYAVEMVLLVRYPNRVMRMVLTPRPVKRKSLGEVLLATVILLVC